jgi:hypothetical protein
MHTNVVKHEAFHASVVVRFRDGRRVDVFERCAPTALAASQSG